MLTEVKIVDDYLQSKSEYAENGLASYQDVRDSENPHNDSEELSTLRWNLLDTEGIGDKIMGATIERIYN